MAHYCAMGGMNGKQEVQEVQVAGGTAAGAATQLRLSVLLCYGTLLSSKKLQRLQNAKHSTWRVPAFTSLRRDGVLCSEINLRVFPCIHTPVHAAPVVRINHATHTRTHF
jgi:hypothetical protein